MDFSSGIIDINDIRGQYVVISVTAVIIMLVVLLHFEALQLLSNLLPRLPVRRSRLRIIFLIFGLFMTHMLEIWLFAFGCLLVERNNYLNLGHLQGHAHQTLLDYVYYSAVVYTSLGFGDLVPVGAIRFLTAMETLCGLLLIGWSVSFTFLEMQRFWKRS